MKTEIALGIPDAMQQHTLSRKHSRVGKTSSNAHQQALLVTAFFPLAIEIIRLIEELIKFFMQ